MAGETGGGLRAAMGKGIQVKERQAECDNCGFETTVFEIKTGAVQIETHNYCGVCSGTFLSKATSYPEQVSDPALYKSIGYIANWILDEISKIKGGKAES